MNRWRANYGLAAIVIASLVVVQLNLACAILSSESPMPHESYIRMTDAAHALSWLFLILQIVAGWLLVSRLKTQKPLPAKLLLSIGLSLISIVATLICGLGLSIIGEQSWYRLAEELFS
jgi:asparagine N-glycosylation enzyme membrane subunit Stt3